MPVSAIREAFGLTAYRFRLMRTEGGWVARPAVAKPGPLQGRRPAAEEAAASRLTGLVTIGLAMLEKRIAEEGMNEANARTLTELMRAQEISMRTRRNEKAAKAREKKSKDARDDFRDDPDWLIAEITRKLDRIAEAGSGRGADGAAAADRE
jgi:hypothetical protein